MRASVIFARSVLLSVSALLPAALLGAALAGRWGALAGAFIAMVALILVGSLAERIAVKISGASEKVPPGLEQSLQYAMGEPLVSLPRLLVVADPVANALVARQWRGRGIILVNQGLLAILDEQELRAILRESVLHVREGGLVFRSVSALLAQAVFQIVPRSWARSVLLGRSIRDSEKLSPLTALAFTALLPWMRHLMNLSRRPDVLRRASAHTAATPGPYSNAIQKMTTTQLSDVLIRGPGMAFLHLLDPWSTRSIFPLFKP